MPATTDTDVAVGVIGVGSMGRHHARVYREVMDADLVGVADADASRARSIADDYGTDAVSTDELLDRADAVSVATPTEYHYDVARTAIERGVSVLVEKPFVSDPADGRDLIDLAAASDAVLQVGHVERFNPAVRALGDVLEDVDVIAASANRLGPPVDRDVDDPVMDLMIHDIDVLRTVVDGAVTDVHAVAVDPDPYVTATLAFDSGVVGRLTSSRVTQQKVRTLSITARECRITVDYIERSIRIHRRSEPEYVADDGDFRYRTKNIVERPTIENGEPLKAELSSFVDTVAEGGEPAVTGEDGLRALELAHDILAAADRDVTAAGDAPERVASGRANGGTPGAADRHGDDAPDRGGREVQNR